MCSTSTDLNVYCIRLTVLLDKILLEWLESDCPNTNIINNNR